MRLFVSLCSCVFINIFVSKVMAEQEKEPNQLLKIEEMLPSGGGKKGATNNPKNGGIVKNYGAGFIEVAIKKSRVNIYFYDKEMQPGELREHSVEVQFVSRPGEKQNVKMKLGDEKKFFSGKLNAPVGVFSQLYISAFDPAVGRTSKYIFDIGKKKQSVKKSKQK